MTAHGFELPPERSKVSDVELLDLPLDTIQTMSNQLSKYEYNCWKRIVIKEVLANRVHANDYSCESTSKINFTIKSLRFVEDEIKLLGTNRKLSNT